MARHDILPERPTGKFAAMHLIGEFIHSRRLLPPTPKQEAFLRQQGLWRAGISRGEAFDAIKELTQGDSPER